ncbi:MAG: hypothetical protein QXJ84_01890 [Desulfurococcaceae archaeon]
MGRMRGDLSAPVLAIIVTIGIIAAGLVLLAWFWWFAPQAGRAGVLQVLGMPTFICEELDDDGNCVKGALVLSVKNVGNADVTIKQVVTPYFNSNNSSKVVAGSSVDIRVEVNSVNRPIPPGTLAVDGAILTDLGTYSFTASIVWPK